MITPEWTDAGTLLLRIDPADWPPPVRGLELDGVRFAPKDELHVTLVGRVLGESLRNAVAEGRVAASEVENAIAAQDWEFRRGGGFLRIQKRARGGDVIGSVIERVAMPAMAGLHARLGELVGRELPVPPPHVTLYVAGRAEGIGVASEAELRELVVREVAEEELRG